MPDHAAALGIAPAVFVQVTPSGEVLIACVPDPITTAVILLAATAVQAPVVCVLAVQVTPSIEEFAAVLATIPMKAVVSSRSTFTLSLATIAVIGYPRCPAIGALHIYARGLPVKLCVGVVTFQGGDQ
jgi:hypothetical protein